MRATSSAVRFRGFAYFAMNCSPTLCTVSGSRRFASAFAAAGSSPRSTAARAVRHASRASASDRAG